MNTTSTIIIFLASIMILILFGKVLVLPLKIIIKLILNSILGGLIITLINYIGASFGLHIGLNIITTIFVGLLGIPGAILLIIFKLLGL